MRKLLLVRVNRIGFTLVELLIVILIVGILATIALPKFKGLLEKAKQAEAYGFFSIVRQAQLAYFDEEGFFADRIEYLGVELPSIDERYFEYGVAHGLDQTGAVINPGDDPKLTYTIMAHPEGPRDHFRDIPDHPHLHVDINTGSVIGYPMAIWMDPSVGGPGTSGYHEHGDHLQHIHEGVLPE